MKKILISVIGLCVTGFVMTAQPNALSLDECRAMALTSNRQLAAAAEQEQQARAMVSVARANYFPDFTATATGLYSTAKGNVTIEGGNLPVFAPDGAGAVAPTGSYAWFPGLDLGYKVGTAFRGGVEVTQPIYQGGRIRASVDMAHNSLEAASIGRDKVAVDVIVEVSRAYAGVVKATQAMEIARAYRSTVAEVKSNVEAAIRHGLRHKNDLLKVDVRLNEADLDILRASNSIRLAKMNLCRLVGLPMTSEIEIIDDLPEVVVPQYIDGREAIEQRPEARMLRAKSKALEARVRLSKGEMLPKIGVMAGYHYDWGLEMNGSRLFDGGSFAVMLNVSVPIYHFGGRSNKVKADRALYHQAEIDRCHAEEMMELEMRRAYSDLEEAEAAYRLTGTALDQAAENMRVSRSMLDNGMETLSDYLEAQTLWRRAAMERMTSRYDRYVSYLEYCRASASLRP